MAVAGGLRLEKIPEKSSSGAGGSMEDRRWPWGREGTSPIKVGSIISVIIVTIANIIIVSIVNSITVII